MILLPPLLSILLLVAPPDPRISGPAPSLRSATTQASVSWGPWYELRPLEHAAGSKSVVEAGAPEKELKAMDAGEPGPDLEREFEGKGGALVRWCVSEHRATDEYPLDDQDPIDLTAGLETARCDNAAAYLYRRIDASDSRTIPVLVGSDDGLRLWLNGELLLDISRARGLSERGNLVMLGLEPGINHLLAKVNNGGGAWKFQLTHDPVRVAELRRDSEEEVNAAIDRGIDYLLSTQYRDGTWNFMTGEYRNGQTALSVYTLLKSGISPRHDAVRRAIEYLRSRPPAKTYSVGCQIMAFAATKDPALRGDIEAMVASLVDWQRQGGFAYPHGAIDLSCTQYAALGLRAAAAAGVPVRDKVWDDLLDHVLPYQTEEGGFPYRKGGPATGSMTAAGLTVLGAAREHLRENKAPARRIRTVEKALEAGVEWLSRYWAVHENPMPTKRDGGADRWMPYYLYGLERVGAFCGLSRIGPHDWYWDGAQHLLGIQGAEGQWGTPYGETDANTCFALLFLQRATATVSGGRERTRPRTFATSDPAAAIRLNASGDSPLTVWISGWGADVLSTHAWPTEKGGGLRVRKVEYRVDGETTQVVTGDPTADAGFERFATRLEFGEPGSHVLAARVTLAKPPPESNDVVIVSPDLEVQVGDLVDEATLPYATDATRNLLAEARFTTTASSQFNGGRRADLAVDQRLSTCWLSSNKDEEPWLMLEMKKGVRANTILVSQALPEVRKPLSAARFTRLEVIINKRRKKSILLDTTTDLFRKTEIPLGKPETIRFLEFRILDREKGEQHEKAVGFAEVELQLRK